MNEHLSVENLPYANELKTCLPYTESKLRETITQGVGAASTCWEHLDKAGIFESNRAKEIAERLIDDVLELTELGQANLGCATTGELLNELRSRIELGNCGLEYRTVDNG